MAAKIIETACPVLAARINREKMAKELAEKKAKKATSRRRQQQRLVEFRLEANPFRQAFGN